MLTKYILFIIYCLAIEALAAPKLQAIRSYEVQIQRCRYQQLRFITLRHFEMNQTKYVWGAEELSLKTHIVPEKELEKCQAQALSAADAAPVKLPYGPYFKALERYNTWHGQLQNDGLKADTNNRSGSFLTIDLCPSKHGLDRNLFLTIKEHQQPLAIAVSGLWILKHEDDWEWLQTTFADYPLIWVNHSRNHPYYPDRPLDKNYLLSEGRDIRKEILEAEKILLQRGITPSIFFRFPGLVANEAALSMTRSLGLIPLGSNAWLGKGQKPKPGSIILVHGNGNDLKGIKLYEEYLQSKQFAEPFRELLSIFEPKILK
jgi:peptidoglycan/xylan/chitin deacetylase (PgdA/CDA1 family)